MIYEISGGYMGAMGMMDRTLEACLASPSRVDAPNNIVWPTPREFVHCVMNERFRRPNGTNYSSRVEIDQHEPLTGRMGPENLSLILPPHVTQ